jgi:GT2 family glycosyltransferase
VSGGALDPAKVSTSVVVCCYDPSRWPALERSLASLEHQTRTPAEVIVVIDGSHELSRLVRSSGRPVRIVDLERRGGLSRARNAGVAAATGDLVAFLDDDATAEPDWLELLAGATSEEDVLGAGGFSEPAWLGERPAWFATELLWIVGCSYRGLPEARTAVRNVFGGCACYRRALLVELDGFRADLGRLGENGSGGEETEFCVRALAAHSGRRFLFLPQARIHHEVPPSRTRVGYVLRRAFAEGRAKASMARVSGGGAVLSTERAYLTGVLVPSVGRDLARALRRLDPTALLAAAVQLGVAASAVAGYVAERGRSRARVDRSSRGGSE